MFSDPMVAVMTMLLLFFIGMVLMFLFMVRILSSHKEDFRESLRKQQILLADMERQLREIGFSLRGPQEGGDAVKNAAGMRSSADSHLLSQDENLLSRLEAVRKKKSAEPGFDDLLLPPKQKNRSFSEEYDPANDPNLFEDPFLSTPSSPPGRRPDRLKRGS